MSTIRKRSKDQFFRIVFFSTALMAVAIYWPFFIPRPTSIGVSQELLDEVKAKLGNEAAQELVQCDSAMGYWQFASDFWFRISMIYCSGMLLLSIYGCFINWKDHPPIAVIDPQGDDKHPRAPDAAK